MKKTLYIDFETRSEADVSVVGTHAYASHPSTCVLLVSWAVDSGPIHTEEAVGEELWRMLEDDNVLKIAHNAEFEIAICRYVLGIQTALASWHDTAYQAAYFGFPRKLSYLAEVLHTTRKASQEEMLFFTRPVKYRPRASAALQPHFHTREDWPEEWERFVQYSAGDVEVMRECYERMAPLPAHEAFVMRFTFLMNFAGVPFDLDFARRIKAMADNYADSAGREASEQFGVTNLRSTPQVQEALRRAQVNLDSLNKKTRAGVEHRLLELRDMATGAAFAKIVTAERRICPDLRLRGEFVGYGAHTGRWSSRGTQLQNFARILSDVSDDLSKVRNYDHLRQHMRLCIHAPEPYKFMCADLSQIEARVVAWLAGCEWRMKAFAEGSDIYSRSAERMFGLPHVDKTMPERQMGKCAELGLGFGGAIGAIERIAPDFYREQGQAAVSNLVRLWRDANPEICRLWRILDQAFRDVLTRCVLRARLGYTSVVMRSDGRNVSIELPSGRALYYRDVVRDANGELSYSDYSRTGRAISTRLWGGILTENVTQAIARDVLVDIIIRVCQDHPSYQCIGTVHDEVWYLVKDDEALDNLLDAMSQPITWAEGLVTKGDGFISNRYIK